MLEVLKFIFSDIWHFLGTCVLLYIVSFTFNGFIYIDNSKGEDKEDE